MKIELKKFKLSEIFDGYKNLKEDGVFAYGGKLNIRPPYQREFIYKEPQRNAVIETVNKGFPLNVMYWAKNSEDSYEVLDGQQRTMSIMEYMDNQFSFNFKQYQALTNAEKSIIDNYELFVYVCEGNDKEKLDWFKTINIAGEKLTNQELRNAVYVGKWLTDAKMKFSKSNSPAQTIGSKYLKGSPIRQEYLETIIEWARDRDGIASINEYMSIHMHVGEQKNYENLDKDTLMKLVKFTKFLLSENNQMALFLINANTCIWPFFDNEGQIIGNGFINDAKHWKDNFIG